MANNRLQLLAAGIAGGGMIMAGAAVAYFVINNSGGIRHKSKRRQGTVRGFYNMGSTCFANALLQSLSACKSFMKWLEALGPVGDEQPLLLELQVFMKELDTSTDRCPVSAGGIFTALHHHRWNIAPDTEQDLFELLNVLVATWDEEIHGLDAATTFSFSDISQLEFEEPKESPAFYTAAKTIDAKRRYRPPCVGLIATQLFCRSCNSKSTRHDQFCSLDLALPRTSSFQTLTIEQCLRSYFYAESLDDYRCENCGVKAVGGIFKKQSISKLPEMLILRIRRVFYSSTGHLVKRNDHVNFNEFLDLKHYLCQYGNAASNTSSANQSTTGSFGWESNGVTQKFDQRYLYKLCAVAVHMGRPETGHFVAYRRGAAGQANNWYYTSDLDIKKVSFDDVTKREAYMLFYERFLKR